MCGVLAVRDLVSILRELRRDSLDSLATSSGVCPNLFKQVIVTLH